MAMNKMPFHQQDAVQQGLEICTDNSTAQICALKREAEIGGVGAPVAVPL